MRAVIGTSRSHGHGPNTRQCRGVALVEALIAALILAIGLMGVASLTIEAVQNGHGALLRTQAVNLVSDMQERIRANPLGAAAYDCAHYTAGPSLIGCAPSGAAPAGVNCTARELAEDDLAEWQSAAKRALPPVGQSACEANVTYVAGAANEPSRYLVSVSWQQRGALGAASYQSELLVSPPPAS